MNEDHLFQVLFEDANGEQTCEIVASSRESVEVLFHTVWHNAKILEIEDLGECDEDGEILEIE